MMKKSSSAKILIDKYLQNNQNKLAKKIGFGAFDPKNEFKKDKK